MSAHRSLAELVSLRVRLRERIRRQRGEMAAAAARVVVPLRWLDLGLRVHRLMRRACDRRPPAPGR